MYKKKKKENSKKLVTKKWLVGTKTELKGAEILNLKNNE